LPKKEGKMADTKRQEPSTQKSKPSPPPKPSKPFTPPPPVKGGTIELEKVEKSKKDK